MLIIQKFILCLVLSSLGYSNCYGLEDENSQANYLVPKSRNCLVINFWPFGDYSEIVTEVTNYNFFMIADKSIPPQQLEPLQYHFKKIILIDNYFSSGKVEIEALRINQDHPLDSIVAFDEFDMLRASRLRDHLKMELGQSYESALAFRDKFIMKSCLKNHNVEIPCYAKINCALDAIEFLSENPLMVLKPTRGAGAEKTVIIKNLEDLNKILETNIFFGHYHFSNLIAEEFIHGEMYNINGFVLNNEIVFIWPNKYFNTCLEMVQGKFLSNYTLSPENPMVPRLINYTKKILSLLPTPKNTAFHLEVFHTQKDELIFCEIASRISGGMVATDLESAFGINLVREDFLIQAGVTRYWDIERKISSTPKVISGNVDFPARIGTLLSLPDSLPFEWVKKYETKLKVNNTVTTVRSITDRVARASFIAESEDQFLYRLAELVEWFEKNVRWESSSTDNSL